MSPSAKHQPFGYRLAMQTILPEDYRDNQAFARVLEALRRHGFSGVELNMARFDQTDLNDVRQFLADYDLKLTMFATGLTAKTMGLSLSSDQARVWERSVEACCRMISFVAGSDAGIIIGFLKGPAREDITGARKRFQKALERIAPKATRHRVKVLVEATNRYEAAVGNSLADTLALIEHLDCPWMRILPDTFHMNIEEADTHSALKRYAPFYESVHLSDNNRYLPGFGAIDFGSIFATLKQNGYGGMLALEGNLKIDLITDLETTINYLKPLLDV